MSNNFIHHILDSKEEIFSWKDILSQFSLESINQHFENYKTCSLYYRTNAKRIEMAVDSLFKIDYQSHSFSPNFKYCITPEKRPLNFPYYFFRIRKLIKGSWFDMSKDGIDFDTVEFEEIQSLKDIWERPAEEVEYYQRLNMPHSSVLYTSLMPSTAVIETNLKNKDLFFLIVYKSTGNFSYSDCSNFVYFDGLTEEENMKRYILFYLLRDEFTRILPESYEAENQYCSSYYISKKFFISEDSQAIQYPSTRGLGHKNFAFWGNIREYLEFVGLRFCYLNNKDGTQSRLSILADCFWDDESRRFEYLSPYSEKSMRIFGEPLLSAMLQK
jgi:hypothetical protein